jgi:putative ABC transport system permease protein
MDKNKPGVFAPVALEKIPELESYLRILSFSNYVSVNNNTFKEDNCILADSNFFDFLGWQLISGNSSSLKDPYTLVISESLAHKYFGNRNPIGEVLNINGDYRITGVFKDIPTQSHIKANIIASLSSARFFNSGFLESWGCYCSEIYFKIKGNPDLTYLNHKITQVWDQNAGRGANAGTHISLKLQKFNEIYLYSTAFKQAAQYGNIYYVLAVGLIAFVILLISCFNFINLTLVQQFKQSKKIQINKALGAGKRSLVYQLFTKIMLIAIVSSLIALAGANYFLPKLNDFLGKQLDLNYKYIFISFTAEFLFIVTVIGFSITIIFSKSGVLFNRNIFQKLKIQPQANLWKKFVLVQFILSTFLIISSLVINKQIHFIYSYNAGYNKENVMIISNSWDISSGDRYERFKQKVEQYPFVKLVSSGFDVPTGGVQSEGSAVVINNPEKKIPTCAYIAIDTNYFTLLRTEFISGRNFKNNCKSEDNSVIVSEAFSKELGIKNCIGTKISIFHDGKEREIIGVVKDMGFYSIHERSKPAVFLYKNDVINYSRLILVKLSVKGTQAEINKISNDWKAVSNNTPFDYCFLNDKFEELYKKETKAAELINSLTIIATILCCLGLFGISLFTINIKTKEIGIRKVNGARSEEMMLMLNRDFLKLVVIAFIIACPIAYYAMHKWLQNFAYKTELSWWVFALAGLVAVAVAVLTVSWQSWKAATRNPVESLRYE